MGTYRISIPDFNMEGAKLSGVDINKCPFKILGSVLLYIDRGGFIQYTVKETDFNKLFPVGQNYYTTTSMFDTMSNFDIGGMVYGATNEFLSICFNDLALFSKHKIDTNHWKVIIYDPSDEILKREMQIFDQKICDRVSLTHEFKY